MTNNPKFEGLNPVASNSGWKRQNHRIRKLWCDASLRGKKVMAQYSKFEITQKLFISVLIDILFVLLITNTQVSFPTVISQPTPFFIISFARFLTPLIHSLSFSLSLSSAYSPLCFYLSPFYIKGYWFCMSVIIE
jgi:hypothetical protein